MDISKTTKKILIIFTSVLTFILLTFAIFGSIYKPKMLNEPLDFSSPSGNNCFEITKTCETNADCAACSASTGIEFTCNDNVCTTALSPATLECNYSHGGRLVLSGDEFTESTNYNCTCTWPMWVGPGCNDLNPAICQIVWQPVDSNGNLENVWYQSSGFDLENFEKDVADLSYDASDSSSPSATNESQQYIDAMYDNCNCIPTSSWESEPSNVTYSTGIPITNVNTEDGQTTVPTKIRGSFGWPICGSYQYPQNNCDTTEGISSECDSEMATPQTTWYLTTWDPIISPPSGAGQPYLTEAQREAQSGLGTSLCECLYPVEGAPGNCWLTEEDANKYENLISSPSGEEDDLSQYQFNEGLCTNNGQLRPVYACCSTLETPTRQSPCTLVGDTCPSPSPS
jgi:hypothetical protein